MWTNWRGKRIKNSRGTQPQIPLLLNYRISYEEFIQVLRINIREKSPWASGRGRGNGTIFKFSNNPQFLRRLTLWVNALTKPKTE